MEGREQGGVVEGEEYSRRTRKMTTKKTTRSSKRTSNRTSRRMTTRMRMKTTRQNMILYVKIES